MGVSYRHCMTSNKFWVDEQISKKSFYLRLIETHWVLEIKNSDEMPVESICWI